MDKLAKEAFEDGLRKSEEYFQSIEDDRICPHCGKSDKELPEVKAIYQRVSPGRLRIEAEGDEHQ